MVRSPRTAIWLAPTGCTHVLNVLDPLLHEYRRLDLTYEKDRGMAFAGIAEVIAEKTGFTYLAGIWKEHAATELLWAIVSPSKKEVASSSKGDAGHIDPKRRSEPAPSWSWFSVPAGQGYSGKNALETATITDMEHNQRFSIYRAQIIDFACPQGTTYQNTIMAPLHDFDGLSISLKCRLVPCNLKWDGPDIRLLPYGRCFYSEFPDIIEKETSQVHTGPDPNELLIYAHDNVQIDEGDPLPDKTYMMLTILEAGHLLGKREYQLGKLDETTTEGEGRKLTTFWKYAGLVIAPSKIQSSGMGDWRRVGLFVCHGQVKVLRSDILTPFKLEDSEDQVINLL